MTVSLPTIWLFGSGSKDEEGNNVHKWYHDFKFTYRPSIYNFSNRTTKDSTYIAYIDTTFEVDTLGDTTFTFTEIEGEDKWRSRKEYVRINHSPSLSLPGIKLLKYINIIPKLNYSETWVKIFETDQSRDLGLDASEIYKMYTYNGSVSMNTSLYGTVNPNIGSLKSIRHEFIPSIAYTWFPEIDKHPDIRAFAGGVSSSKKSVVAISLQNVFKAKTVNEDKEKTLTLLSLTTSFSYNFENFEKPLSDIRTSFSTSSLPGINFSGSINHTIYDPDPDSDEEKKFFSPFLRSWNMNMSFTLRGNKFLFDELETGIPLGADSAHNVGNIKTQPKITGRKGWSLGVTFNFKEDGFHTANYNKSSQLGLNLGFNLTPATSVTYAQTYNVVEKKIIHKRVSIVRIIHCWTGSLYWVPSGSNRGFGFKLNVTDIPDIKIDSNHDTFQVSSINPAGL